MVRGGKQRSKGLDVGDVNIVVAHVSELQSHYIVVDSGTASAEREAHHVDVTLRHTSTPLKLSVRAL